MKKFWIIDGSGEEYETKELAIEAAKRRSASFSKNPLFISIDDCYVYEAIAVARTPTPDIQVEEITA
jgi:hypothetical protein